MQATQLKRWLARVFGWDGVLPACVVLLPAVARAVMPNDEKPIILLALAVPITALLIRYFIGRRAIALNRVGPVVRACQHVVFTAAIFWLLLVDCFMIALHLTPEFQNGGFDIAGLCFLSALYLPYLGGMLFALFPGREEWPIPISDSQENSNLGNSLR